LTALPSRERRRSCRARKGGRPSLLKASPIRRGKRRARRTRRRKRGRARGR